MLVFPVCLYTINTASIHRESNHLPICVGLSVRYAEWYTESNVPAV